MHAIQYVAYETAFGWSFQLIVDLCVAAMNRIILCNIIRLCLFKKPALFTWDCGIFLLLSKRFCFVLFMTRLQKAQYMRLKMNRSDVHTNIVYQHIRIEKEKKRKFQTDTNKLFVYLHICLDVAAIRLLNVNNFEVNYLQLSIVYCKKSESTSILRLSIHRMLIWFDKKTDKWSRFNKFKVLEILGYSSSAVSTNRTCIEWFYCVKYDIIDVSIQRLYNSIRYKQNTLKTSSQMLGIAKSFEYTHTRPCHRCCDYYILSHVSTLFFLFINPVL